MYKKLIICCMIAGTGASLCATGLGADKPADQNAEIRKLSLVPASEPVPAMSYRLLPRRSDQKIGNAALFYYSAAALFPDGDPGDSESAIDKIVKWRYLPFDELPRDEVEKVLSSISKSFHQVALATQRSGCYWQMPLEDGFSLEIPHLSTFRRIIFAMRLQIRLKIADGHTDEAIELLQQGMQMGRNIAEGPTLIQDLVGVAISALLLKEVEGMMQEPDSPNFYWALTALPDPMIDMYPALESEREMLFMEFPQLRDLEDQVLTPPQASAIASEFMKKIAGLTTAGPDDIPFKGLLPLAWVMMHYSDAKQFLAGRGFSRERIDAMPAAQAVLSYQKLEYVEMMDSQFKWFTVPYHLSQPHLEKGKKLFDKLMRGRGLKANLFSTLVPALHRVSFIHARLDRQIAMLRTIEAIRMFAADHSGSLPGSLAEIDFVPIPVDPVTGENFLYRRTNAFNARLEAPVSPAELRKRRPVYELTVKR